MSYGCLYILRGVSDIEELHRKLLYTAKRRGCGLCFDPRNNLLLENSVEIKMNDFAFEVCDSFCNSDASLLLSYEGYTINGKKASLPLLERLKTLQDFVLNAVPHAEAIEIYLGEDTPYLPDYSDHKIACTEVTDTLYKEYQRDSSTPFIPCVHLMIE